MGTKVANLETQDALLFHRASAALDFCSHLWICCHFGFGIGDDALFLRIVARVVVYCWLENLNGYYCYHVFVFAFLFSCRFSGIYYACWISSFLDDEISVAESLANP